MTEPTDAEIWQMWMPMVRRMGVADPVEFARAVLAKWGTPAPVGVESACQRCRGSGEDPEGYYDQSRGPDGATHDGPCRICAGSGGAPVVLAKWCQPQAVAGEPVAIYHGRCAIDCGEHGHLDMELLKMIPAGSKLYTTPQPTQAQTADYIRNKKAIKSTATR